MLRWLNMQSDYRSRRTWEKFHAELGHNISWRQWKQEFVRFVRSYYINHIKLRSIINDQQLPQQTCNNYYINLSLVTHENQQTVANALKEEVTFLAG